MILFTCSWIYKEKRLGTGWGNYQGGGETHSAELIHSIL